MRHDVVLPVRISENLREGMFDQAYFGQYGKFQEGIGGILGRMGCLTGRSWDCGESIVLLISLPSGKCLYVANRIGDNVCVIK